MKRFLLKDLPKEKETEALELYAKKLTTYQVAKKIGISQSSVVKILKKNNIKAKEVYDYYTHSKVNLEFFNIIDTEVKAYFLGLMFADGNNSRKRNGKESGSYRVSISLQECDKHILDTFLENVAPKQTLKFINKKKYNKRSNNQYQLLFSDKTISNQLIELGCIPAKSLILQYPYGKIPEHLEKHFIRGYFDGDGCITTNGNKGSSKQYIVNMVSTELFCNSIKDIIYNHTNIIFNIKSSPIKNGRLYYTYIGGNHQVEKFMSWLYHDATIFLHRKYDIFLKLKKTISEIDAQEKESQRLQQLVLSMRASNVPVKTIIKETGFSQTHVYRLINK